MEKKTTLNIEEGLYASIRETAARRRVSTSQIVAEALTLYDARPQASRNEVPSLTIAQGGGWIGPKMFVSNGQLLDLMEENEPLDGIR